MKEAFFNMVKFTFILAIIVVIMVCICSYADKIDKEKYNNGICTECGGDYIFSSAVHVHSGGDDYYYTCNKCGHTIKTDNLMK